MNNKNYKDYKILITKFSTNLSSLNEFNDSYINPKYCYNLKVVDGALVQGNGIKELTIPLMQTPHSENLFEARGEMPVVAKKLYKYKYYSNKNSSVMYLLVILGSDKKIYATPLFFWAEGYYALNHTFISEPNGINFRIDGDDVMGFSSKDDDLLVWYCDDDPYVVSTAPRFKSVCFHNERLFAIDTTWDYIVRYSANCNPLDWRKDSLDQEEAGMLELNDYKGELKNLFSFMENVYVFRDQGISKINTYLKSDYTTSNIYDAGQRIYCSSACVCGDKIYFLQQDGLYFFDGYDVEKVEGILSDRISRCSQEASLMCYHDNKLYIACNLNLDESYDLPLETSSEESTNNSLVEYNLENGDFNILGNIDICSMISVNYLFFKRLVFLIRGGNRLWCLDNSGKNNGQILTKKFVSTNLVFNDLEHKKILKDIKVICTSPFELKINYDNKSKTFNIVPNKRVNIIRVNLTGKEFSFEITSNEEVVKISSIEMNFKILE